MKQSYWLTNAAQEHVHIVRDKGYTQVNMGPKEPLEKMNKGDWILYYSPTVLFDRPDTPCQKFTGISYLTDHLIYQQPTNPERWRRNAQYFHCIPHDAEQFHHHVDFLHKHDNWLDAFAIPVFEISQSDFITIAHKIVIPSAQYQLVF